MTTHAGYIPQYFVPPPPVNEWMEGDWTGYDRDASERAAEDLLLAILEAEHPCASVIIDRGALQPTYQGVSYVGTEAGCPPAAITALTGASVAGGFADAYEAVYERSDDWLVPIEEDP